eukprot:147117-Chlamydomonas_euryale.AAC.1
MQLSRSAACMHVALAQRPRALLLPRSAILTLAPMHATLTASGPHRLIHIAVQIVRGVVPWHQVCQRHDFVTFLGSQPHGVAAVRLQAADWLCCQLGCRRPLSNPGAGRRSQRRRRRRRWAAAAPPPERCSDTRASRPSRRLSSDGLGFGSLYGAAADSALCAAERTCNSRRVGVENSHRWKRVAAFAARASAGTSDLSARADDPGRHARAAAQREYKGCTGRRGVSGSS